MTFRKRNKYFSRLRYTLIISQSKMKTIIGRIIINGSIFISSSSLSFTDLLPILVSIVFSKKAASPVRNVEIPARK